MDLVLIELILWIGLLFFFWALKEGLSGVESDIESLGLANGRMHPRPGTQYYRPERVEEPIGSYRDKPIYRYIVISGRTYQFDRVCPQGCSMTVDADERCIEPGLVYQECAPRNLLPGST